MQASWNSSNGLPNHLPDLSPQDREAALSDLADILDTMVVFANACGFVVFLLSLHTGPHS